ncbi:hypothetical protein [Croceicoccus hydrothermalis]|uniref:hypothetical protein n=1 Tax=Croceicoccus hydrothermalis TaxID=2867964 RepID=UPI001EFA6282|nr:hypothetical protein [Croceicoccus hydrothermalis]
MDWLATEIGKLSLLGIYGLIAGAAGSLLSGYIFPKWLQKQKSELEVEAEQLRFKLKRQELMFERELKAAEDFFRLYDKILGLPRVPDADWSEGQLIIAEKFYGLESQLTKFLNKHEVAISERSSKSLASARHIANQGSFDVAQETSEGEYEPGQYPGQIVQKAVDEFWERIEEARKQIREDLSNGSLANPSKS